VKDVGRGYSIPTLAFPVKGRVSCFKKASKLTQRAQEKNGLLPERCHQSKKVKGAEDGLEKGKGQPWSETSHKSMGGEVREKGGTKKGGPGIQPERGGE